MKVYNQEKTMELHSYDLSLGYLKDDRVFVRHHPAVPPTDGVFHYEALTEYHNGGRDVRKVWDIPKSNGSRAYDEYEDILVFVPYTQKELDLKEVSDLKRNLLETDYQAIKFAEGAMSADDFAEIKAKRQEWRNRINQIEEIYRGDLYNVGETFGY